MKYSINIKSAFSLKVCVGEFETFEKAKVQMTKFIIELIGRQRDEVIDAWENLKEDFSVETQEILNSFEENGTANIDDEIYDENGDVTYYSDEGNLVISGKQDDFGYSLSMDTNAINMYDLDENYYFTLTKDYEGGKFELTVELLVNDGSVEVYDILSDDVRSLLEPIDLEDDEQ